MNLGITSDVTPENEEELRALYPPPRDLPILDHLDRACCFFIAHSPLLIVGSVSARTGIDLSPRGGAPGFARVLDDRTLVIPDRAGNNRLDTMTNLLPDNKVGLLFVIPGVQETLRIKGTARLSGSPYPVAPVPDGDRGRLVITVSVICAFIHCARALHHARIWASDFRIDPREWSLARWSRDGIA